jgi:hypothetical protein
MKGFELMWISRQGLGQAGKVCCLLRVERLDAYFQACTSMYLVEVNLGSVSTSASTGSSVKRKEVVHSTHQR